MLAGPDTRWKRAGADPPGRPMEHRAMRRVAAAIVPALHAALKSLAFADAAHVDVLAHFEAVHQNAIARLGLVLGVCDLHFAQTPHGCNAGLLEMPSERFRKPLRLDELDETELHRVVTVFVLG